MCELKVIQKGKTIMEDVVRMTQEREKIILQSLLGETKIVSGRILEVNLTKQEAIIDG